jgi:hypothetical protein
MHNAYLCAGLSSPIPRLEHNWRHHEPSWSRCRSDERRLLTTNPESLPMPEEPLTLAELQTAKDTLETKVHRLREVLHKLAAARPDGWRAEFAVRQSELIEVADRIGWLNKRMRALVEKEAGPAREEDRDA